MNKKKAKKAAKKTTKKSSKKPVSNRSTSDQKPVTRNPVKSLRDHGANKSGVQPLGDRVLLKPLTAEEAGTTTSFGIIIPETVDKEKPEQGTVIAVGPGKRGDDNELIPVAVSVGDKVMFSKYGFDEIKVDGVEYYILPESSILAVLTK